MAVADLIQRATEQAVPKMVTNCHDARGTGDDENDHRCRAHTDLARARLRRLPDTPPSGGPSRRYPLIDDTPVKPCKAVNHGSGFVHDNRQRHIRIQHQHIGAVMD